MATVAGKSELENGDNHVAWSCFRSPVGPCPGIPTTQWDPEIETQPSLLPSRQVSQGYETPVGIPGLQDVRGTDSCHRFQVQVTSLGRLHGNDPLNDPRTEV